MHDSGMRPLLSAALLFVFALVAFPLAQTIPPAIVYHVTFPEPEHHWLQVEVTWTQLGSAPLKARMSRSSPGRYAVHEFAKNIFWIEAYDGKGQKLTLTRPDVDEWDAA